MVGLNVTCVTVFLCFITVNMSEDDGFDYFDDVDDNFEQEILGDGKWFQ